MNERNRDLLYRLWHPWRLLTSQKGALPSFVIVGTQKGGTTYLYSLLSNHPQIRRSARKEVQYFSLNHLKSERWYRAQFPSEKSVAAQSRALGKPILTGEASPYYMFHPHAMRRMSELLPQAKIVVLLRDPVKRAVSHYHHNVSRKAEELPFEEAIAAETDRLKGERDRMLREETYQSDAFRNFSYFERGVYLPQIQEIERHFPRHQTLVLQSERFFKDALGTVHEVAGFLGIDRWDPPLQVRMNQGKYNPVDPSVLQGLKERFEPTNQELYRHLEANYGW